MFVVFVFFVISVDGVLCDENDENVSECGLNGNENDVSYCLCSLMNVKFFDED